MNESTNGALYRSAEAISKADEHDARRLRAATREVPLPPAPSRFPFGPNYITISVEKQVRAELRHATEIRKYGGGTLARFQHDGLDLALVACGRLQDVLEKMVVCVLRASAPPLPPMSITQAAPLRWYSPRLTPDETLVTGGSEALARALLDPGLMGALYSMRGGLEWLAIRDGAVELAWTGFFPRDGFPLLPDVALAIVTTIAKRLYPA